MKHIITAAQSRLARASLSGGALRDLATTFKELETLIGEPYFKYPNPLPFQGEYPYYLERQSKADESLSDELEELIQVLREAGYHPIKQRDSRGIGWDKWAFQNHSRYLKLCAEKTMGHIGPSKGRMMLTKIRLTPIHDSHVWDMGNDIDQE